MPLSAETPAPVRTRTRTTQDRRETAASKSSHHKTSPPQEDVVRPNSPCQLHAMSNATTWRPASSSPLSPTWVACSFFSGSLRCSSKTDETGARRKKIALLSALLSIADYETKACPFARPYIVRLVSGFQRR